MNTLETQNINLLIDFDSTIIKDESLELLSQISFKNSKNKTRSINNIKNITNDAMNGKIGFSDALIERILLLKAKKNHLKKVIAIAKDNITDSFIQNKAFFKKNGLNCYIVSGGFIEIIYPVLKSFNIPKRNIFANKFIYDKDNNIISIDKNNPLSQNLGKVKIAKNIQGKNIIIGDGYTDYEVKKFGCADKFIQFSENINRESLNPFADYIAYNFDSVKKYINDNYG